MSKPNPESRFPKLFPEKIEGPTFRFWQAPEMAKGTMTTGFLLILLLSSCATANPAVVEAASGPGFWWGLVHGWIATIAFIVSLFDSTVGVYEVANSGGWYDFGFVLGVGSFGGGCASCK